MCRNHDQAGVVWVRLYVDADEESQAAVRLSDAGDMRPNFAFSRHPIEDQFHLWSIHLLLFGCPSGIPVAYLENPFIGSIQTSLCCASLELALPGAVTPVLSTWGYPSLDLRLGHSGARCIWRRGAITAFALSRTLFRLLGPSPCHWYSLGVSVHIDSWFQVAVSAYLCPDFHEDLAQKIGS